MKGRHKMDEGGQAEGGVAKAFVLEGVSALCWDQSWWGIDKGEKAKLSNSQFMPTKTTVITGQWC